MVLEIIRAVIGFFLVLFVPGYALTWAFFPDDSEIDLLERIALAIGLSISSVVLAVYFTNIVFQLKINLVNSLLIILVITVIGAGIGLKRREGLVTNKGVTKKKKNLSAA
ncbi:MAG: DUF1616 domain-containing protein [Candidatus Altiarchaeota archaeon]